MDNELMIAIWQSPAILLHQRNKGVAKQFLLSLVFSCQTTTTTTTTNQHMDMTMNTKYTNTGSKKLTIYDLPLRGNFTPS